MSLRSVRSSLSTASARGGSFCGGRDSTGGEIDVQSICFYQKSREGGHKYIQKLSERFWVMTEVLLHLRRIQAVARRRSRRAVSAQQADPGREMGEEEEQLLSASSSTCSGLLPLGNEQHRIRGHTTLWRWRWVAVVVVVNGRSGGRVQKERERGRGGGGGPT